MVTSAASLPARRSATFCDIGAVTSGESAAATPLTRSEGAFRPLRFPTVSIPGNATTLDARSSGAGID
eukprot:6195981-Pleurochrysis_carterae.AAC.1